MPVYTSNLLAQILNEEVVNQAFEIIRANRIGVLSSVRMGSGVPAEAGYKFGWLEGAVGAQGDSVKTAVSTGTATALEVNDAKPFRTGQTISVSNGDEIMLVSSVNYDTNTLTVVRGFGGTTALTSIPVATLVKVEGTAREENSLTATDEIWQPEINHNYFQTMDSAIEFSRRALATMQYGSTNDITFQINERLRQLAIQMNRTLISGRRTTATIGGKEVTYTGGLRFFTDQAGAIKQDASKASLTLDLINNVNAEIVKRGGNTNTIAVGINQARVISNLVSANYDSTRLKDWTADEGSMLRLPSDLPLIGNVNTIVVDTNLSDSELFIYDSSKVTVQPMMAGNAQSSGVWRTFDATTSGQDGVTYRVVGDYGFEIRDSKQSIARIHNLKV